MVIRVDRVDRVDSKEIEKELVNVELAEDIEELKEAIVSLTKVLIKEIKKGEWENCPYLK